MVSDVNGKKQKIQNHCFCFIRNASESSKRKQHQQGSKKTPKQIALVSPKGETGWVGGAGCQRKKSDISKALLSFLLPLICDKGKSSKNCQNMFKHIALVSPNRETGGLGGVGCQREK